MRGIRPQAQPPGPDRPPAVVRAYSELRRKILHGELRAGTTISEADTATVLGVSRTPVREALRELLNEGLLEEGRRRQVVVASLSAELNREVRLMRTALERLAAREAAVHATESDLDQLRLVMIRTRRALAAEDTNTFLDCDDEFHLGIARAAGLAIVEDTVRRLRGYTRLAGLTAGWSSAHLASSADEHDAIVDALETHDPDIAEHALAQHLASLTSPSPKAGQG